MPYRQEVKEIAYKLDPECWVSYAGKSPVHKSRMDHRRDAAINEAIGQWAMENRNDPDPYEADYRTEQLIANDDEQAALINAAENVVIARSTGWNLNGTLDELERALQPFRKTT